MDLSEIIGMCPFPSRFFPEGFEFVLHGVVAAQDEETKEIVYSPTQTGYVEFRDPFHYAEYSALRVEFLSRLTGVYTPTPAGIEFGEYGRCPYEYAEAVLGVSKFVLVDLLVQRYEDEMRDAFMVEILARRYSVVTM